MSTGTKSDGEKPEDEKKAGRGRPSHEADGPGAYPGHKAGDGSRLHVGNVIERGSEMCFEWSSGVLEWCSL
jgi:hypothetical protein